MFKELWFIKLHLSHLSHSRKHSLVTWSWTGLLLAECSSEALGGHMPHCPLGESSQVPRGPGLSTEWFLLRSSFASGPSRCRCCLRWGHLTHGFGCFSSTIRDERKTKYQRPPLLGWEQQVVLVASLCLASCAACVGAGPHKAPGNIVWTCGSLSAVFKSTSELESFWAGPEP